MNLKKISTLTLVTATIVGVGGCAVWFATGAHMGWSQTRIPRTIIDEVTGIEAVVFEDGFVAGIDFLGSVLLLAAVLGLIGWMIRRRKHS